MPERPSTRHRFLVAKFCFGAGAVYGVAEVIADLVGRGWAVDQVVKWVPREAKALGPSADLHIAIALGFGGVLLLLGRKHAGVIAGSGAPGAALGTGLIALGVAGYLALGLSPGAPIIEPPMPKTPHAHHRHHVKHTTKGKTKPNPKPTAPRAAGSASTNPPASIASTGHTETFKGKSGCTCAGHVFTEQKTVEEEPSGENSEEGSEPEPEASEPEASEPETPSTSTPSVTEGSGSSASSSSSSSSTGTAESSASSSFSFKTESSG
jgi:hypothetical protein